MVLIHDLIIAIFSYKGCSTVCIVGSQRPIHCGAVGQQQKHLYWTSNRRGRERGNHNWRILRKTGTVLS